MKPFNSIVDLIRSIERGAEKENFLNYQEENGEWYGISSTEFCKLVRRCALGLYILGVKKGDCVGIVAASSPRWTIADCAIMMCGAVSVPLFANISEENFQYELEQTELKYIFISGDEQWEMIGHFKEKISETIALYDEMNSYRTTSFSELCLEGKKIDSKEPELYESLRNGIVSDDLASIVYTSGTTGLPKGVMLSQNNMIGISHLNPFNWSRNDRYLSVLPLAHIFARSLNLIFMTKMASIYYIRDVHTFGEECKKILPTVLVVVPRLLEKTYASIYFKIEHSSLIKRVIGLFAFSIVRLKPTNPIKKSLFNLLDKLVYSTIRNALGGKIQYIISGGAALNPYICRFFDGIGLPIYEGWGLTEACPLTINLPENNQIGSVGAPLEGIEIKISGKGELLAKGPVVMQGYYKNPTATKEAFTLDGWLRTGDKGSKDKEGRITIFSRIKEMYRTSTGKWIVPVPIEQELCKASYIDMAMVVGEGKKFASCLLFPDFEAIRTLKKQHGLEKLSNKEFLESEIMREKMDKFLKQLNKHLNHWEQVQSYRFVESIPSIGGGELTPTLKLRREIICKKYSNIIKNIYNDEAA